ncbi:MAG: SRPBCC family protein [Proteobacteria bacterium]|nr:SRPBCC family protein [Pseudomonadota bacterium]NOG60843.1 SRPBCC family protein [Pseudomonadota bacterium]
MAKVNMSTDLDVAADKLWNLIGGFNALPDWHPAIENSELQEEGSMRVLSLAGGGEIVERLEKYDDNERIYSYTITDSPLPVKNYRAEIKVIDKGDDKASVEWSSEFSAEGATESEAMDVITGIFQAGLDNLKKMYGG